MAAILFFIFLASVVSFYVVFPIIQARAQIGSWKEPSSNNYAGDLIERKEAIYAAIKDIEFDYQMGKLSKEDYQELRQQYKDEAVKLLKKIVEKQKKVIKGEAIRAKKKDAQANFCWMCGTALVASDKFCANCGEKIE